jgi:excisionase family DNA binding protein
MAAGGYEPPAGYLTVAQAQERLRVSKATIARIIHEQRLPVYRDQRNKRVRLVKVEDVEQLAQPVRDAPPAAL